MFKYLWIIILVLVDILWIVFTVYDFANCYKYNQRKKAFYENSVDVILNALVDMEEISISCIVINAIIIFIASLITFLISAGGAK